MTKEEQTKNILAFLSILFGESEFVRDIMEMTPDYLIEKYNRYILSERPESDWGLHPSLRRQVFNAYCEKWKLPYE